MSDKVYLTREGYDKLKAELDHLKNVVRKEVVRDIKEAREQGDLSENAEYDAAKEKQGRTEGRISQIQEKLSRAEIINKDHLSNSEICIGTKVVIMDLDLKEKFEYTLVDVSEADFSCGKISINSPVAQGLLGHKTGEEVVINLPAKKMRLKILSVEMV
jgi:transcription elongation factor GreA